MKMKNNLIGKIIREAVSILLLPTMFLIVVILFANRDSFVTYDENYYKNDAVLSCNEDTVHTSTDESSNQALQLLSEGVYSIACEGQKICVYNSRNEKVYTAASNLSDFSENDRLVLENKITSLTLNELLEIVEYIES